MPPKKSGSSSGDSPGKTTKKTGKRSKKDKSAPKRPRSAFLCFSIERRQELVKEKPELTSKVAEASKVIGAEWAKLNGTQRQPYTKMAQQDKQRYEKEMQEYEKSKG